MRPPFALLLLALCAGLSRGQFLPLVDFREKLMSSCYRSESDVIDGQREPAASSVDTLIYLVVKLEEQDLNAVQILEYLLRSFSIRDLYRNEEMNFYTRDSYKMTQEILKCSVKTLTFPSDRNLVENDEERCALFFLLSNTLNKTGEMMYREQGVVAVDPQSQPSHAVDISRTLLGIYAGLAENTLSIDSLLKCLNIKLISTPSEQPNSVYFATVAELVGLAAYHTGKGSFKGFVGNGVWNSSHCPMKYQITSEQDSFFTYSRFRGAVDGLILGNWAKKHPKSSLSSLLQTYYGATDVPSADMPLSYGYRRDMVDQLDSEIQAQSKLYAEILGLKSDNPLHNSQEMSDKIWGTIKGTHFDPLFSDFLKNSLARKSIIKQRNDVVNNVIFVLDKDNVEQQMDIVQAVASQLTAGFQTEDSNQASSVEVYLKVQGRLDKLDTPLPRTTNKGAVGCAVLNYLQRNEGLLNKKKKEEADVLEILNDTLTSLKEEQQSKITAPGKAVILFSFTKMNDKPELDKAVRNLRYYHYDVPLYIVASDDKHVPDYVKTQVSQVFSINKADPHKTASEILAQLANNPVAIQFPECQQQFAATAEGALEHKGYITRMHVQRWAISPHYFDRSSKLELTVTTPVREDIDVCVKRRLRYDCVKTLHEVEKNTGYSWEIKNPCQKHHTLCDPIYFIIEGKRKPSSPCEDAKCLHEEQIQFSIKHKGLRCGAMAAASSFGLLALSLFLLFQSQKP